MNRISTASIDHLDFTESGVTADLLTKNWQTTAAVGLTVASGGAAGMIMLAAFPAQTLAAGAAISGLAYAGHRKANGEELLPFLKKSETVAQDAVTTVAQDAATVEPAAA